MSNAIVHVLPRETSGLLPPHDLDAERALVACSFHAPDVLEAAAQRVAPGDFYADQHARIWRELLSLRAEGVPTNDAPTLIRRLRESSTAETVTYATRIVVDDTRLTGTVAHAARYLDSVASMARRRRKIVAAQRAEATLRDTSDPDAEAHAAALLAEATERRDELATSATRVCDIFAGELPDPDWIVPSLQLCPGRPGAIVGYSGQGKTLLAYALALAVASGRPVWGEHRVPRRRRVLVVDLEQGRVPTLRRLRRIARAMKLDAFTLSGWLEVEVFPRASLLAADAHAQLERLTEGFDLVVFDSLRKMISGADENSAEVEVYTRKLLEVSEKTGRTFLVLIHTGKTSPDRMELETVRGSSAIVGDLGSTFLVAREADTGLLKLAHVKASVAADGGRLDPVHVELVDVAEGADPKAGLDVLVVCPEELAERKARAEREARTHADHAEAVRRSIDDIAPLVLDLVRQKPGVLLTVVTAQINRRRELVRGTIDTLINEGALHVRSRPALGGGKMLFPGRDPHEESLSKSVPTSGTNLGARGAEVRPAPGHTKGSPKGTGTNFRHPEPGPKRPHPTGRSARLPGQSSGQSFEGDESDFDGELDS